jgi:hypothetical protein
MVRIIVFTRSETMQINWFLIVVGIVPYSIKRYETKDEQVLSTKALFWQLIIRWKKGQRLWELYIPFIEHLRQE